VTIWIVFKVIRQIREGYKDHVYADSLGNLTVGIGHKVLSEDNLKDGQAVSDAQIRRFFQEDGEAALKEAREQMMEAGIEDDDFLLVLASVNFQLGPSWRTKFVKTWADIVDGDYNAAADEVGRSDWATQSPDRVKDFQQALGGLEPQARQGRKPQ
jgi:GH24 family phage-related lysozyme (muramidase)